MKLLDPQSFERSGGLTIGIGRDHCLYTLRSEFNDLVQMHVGDGLPSEVRTLRQSHHLRNLGKDWAEVAERLPSILAEMGYAEDTEVYVPGHANGRLDPNKSPDLTYVPTSMIPFGQYEGETIEAVLAKNPAYLFYLAESYHPNEERMRGRWMAFLRGELAPQLKERAAIRAAEQAEREKAQEGNRARCAPLAILLRAQSKADGDFCSGMAKHFEQGNAVEDLGERARRIVEEIYAKQVGGRRGSKAYALALEDFDSKFAANQPNEAPLVVRPLPTPTITQSLSPAP